MASSNYIYFGLTGEFDPAQVEAELGLKPTRSMAKHARDTNRQLPRCSLMRFAQLHADTDAGVLDIYTLADNVVDALMPYASRFADVVRRYKIEARLQVVFDFPISDDVSTPIMGFSNRVIQFLADTGASIDMDSYRG
jgi:hypothetical protein